MGSQKKSLDDFSAILEFFFMIQKLLTEKQLSKILISICNEKIDVSMTFRNDDFSTLLGVMHLHNGNSSRTSMHQDGNLEDVITGMVFN